MDCQSEEQPAEIGEPDKAQNDADDDHGGALRANRRLRLLHHHGAGFRIPDLCRLWNPCSEGACSRARAIAVRAGSVYAREKHVQPSRNAVFAAVRACRCAEIRWELLSRPPDPSRSWRRPLPLEGAAEEPTSGKARKLKVGCAEEPDCGSIGVRSPVA